MSDSLIDRARSLAEGASALAREAAVLAAEGAASAGDTVTQATQTAQGGGDNFVFLLTVFALACFVGYYVVWRVTPALHSPLMGVTNAVSSVIIVGALIAAGPLDWNISKVFGLIAVILASVNIFGGFIVTQRMLSMFKKKG